ncbi:MAG: 4-(cytidine 5'-diphospho)-2-C-methyl-D-erythritol kinase, partial [Treponema sp.]|nr:4-(cytidine 5'-diphospho)-2-C-methyl-D-erythritol kinase [Treponema sp.]
LDDLEAVYRSPVKDWTFVNDFTPVIAAKYSKVRQALDDVKASGALFCDMSGSGSTVFGVYESASQAQDAANLLSGKWNAALL